jgi:hypothetical protein
VSVCVGRVVCACMRACECCVRACLCVCACMRACVRVSVACMKFVCMRACVYNHHTRSCVLKEPAQHTNTRPPCLLWLERMGANPRSPLRFPSTSNTHRAIFYFRLFSFLYPLTGGPYGSEIMCVDDATLDAPRELINWSTNRVFNKYIALL